MSATTQQVRRTALVLFPHQLFEDVLIRPPADRVYVIEHPLYITQLPFHKQKLVLHRASMAAFVGRLAAAGVAVRHVRIEEFGSAGAPPSHAGGMAVVADIVRSEGCTDVIVYDLDDDWLERDFRQAFGDMPIRILDSPMFVTDLGTLRSWFVGRARPRMGDFYAYQRRRLGVLLDDRGKPIGGKWSFDSDNRKPLPKSLPVPVRPSLGTGAHARDAVRWADAAFSANYGTTRGFSYPITHEEARASLRFFLEHCLAAFGDYEDAMSMTEPTLFHSVLTPSLNTGLLTPAEVIEQTLAHAAEHRVPLNSLEGFIRQIIGWREFVRGLYHVHGRRQRTLNRFGFTIPMPDAFWKGDTGLLPADTVIRRVLDTGYCHHIERLMVLGSLMLLCELSPDAVFDWFMTLFIDAYDWVMVPNVYGMSQYADGGIMATKPYISGTAYLRRMGDWPPGPWERTWDGLYWRFVDRHRDVFLANPRTSLAARSFDRMDVKVRRAHYDAAEAFLGRLTTQQTNRKQ